jgi:hypothetical protein
MTSQVLYNRFARLRVGIPGQDGIDFTGLRVTFQIEKTSESNSNTSRISIFNLNSNSRAFVEQENLVGILDVGYQYPGQDPVAENIFQGDIKKVQNTLSGGDWVTTFEIGDGEKKLVESHFDKSFAKGASLQTVVNEVAQSFGNPVSVVKGIQDKTFKNGLSLSGGTKEILDNLTSEGGVEWSIQDDEVIILPQEEDDGEQGFLLSRDTGMIGLPIKKEKGLEITTALIAKLRPGRSIKVESKIIEGNYRVRRVLHDGDTHEGNWVTKVEAV